MFNLQGDNTLKVCYCGEFWRKFQVPVMVLRVCSIMWTRFHVLTVVSVLSDLTGDPEQILRHFSSCLSFLLTSKGLFIFFLPPPRMVGLDDTPIGDWHFVYIYLKGGSLSKSVSLIHGWCSHKSVPFSCFTWLPCLLNIPIDLGGGSSLASKLRSLSSESFVQLLAAIFRIVRVMSPVPHLLLVYSLDPWIHYFQNYANNQVSPYLYTYRHSAAHSYCSCICLAFTTSGSMFYK